MKFTIQMQQDDTEIVYAGTGPTINEALFTLYCSVVKDQNAEFLNELATGLKDLETIIETPTGSKNIVEALDQFFSCTDPNCPIHGTRKEEEEGLDYP